MQQNRLMRRTAVYCIAFVLAAMSAMLYYSANKIIVVADVAQDEVVQSTDHEGTAGGENADKTHIKIERDSRASDYFCIPLPDNVKPEEVTLENHYMDQELWVSIDLKDPEDQRRFYENQSVYGDCENVLDGHFDVERKRICLRFALTNVFEYQSFFENNTLYVKFVPPKEVYDKIVVIDPAYGADESGGESEDVKGKNITLDIAKALKTKMDETDIKVYYTRMDDSNPDDRTRVRLAVATNADMLIRIEVGSAKNSRIYGTEAVCNSSFFIPDFGSVELADLLEREVVTAISGKANGLVEVTETDVVIREATVPAAAIKAGYLTNSQEFILLQRDDYVEKIADGIYRTIQKVYDK